MNPILFSLALLGDPQPQPTFQPDRWTLPDITLGPVVVGTRRYVVVRFASSEPDSMIRPHVRLSNGMGWTLDVRRDPGGLYAVVPIRDAWDATGIVLESCYRSHPVSWGVAYADQVGLAAMAEALLSRGRIEERLAADVNYDGSPDGDDIQAAVNATRAEPRQAGG